MLLLCFVFFIIYMVVFLYFLGLLGVYFTDGLELGVMFFVPTIFAMMILSTMMSLFSGLFDNPKSHNTKEISKNKMAQQVIARISNICTFIAVLVSLVIFAFVM